MTFLIRLLRKLGLVGPDDFIRYEQAVSDAVLEIAVRERRAPEDVTLELLHYALDHRQHNRSIAEQWRRLTPRQKEVTALACVGYTNRQIGQKLIVSPETVKTHLRIAMQKFEVRTKSDLRILLADWDFQSWDRSG